MSYTSVAAKGLKRLLGAGDYRRVFALALPAVGEQLLNMTVGLVDTFMVGHIGANAVAAVGLSNQAVMLVTTFFAAVATGVTALVTGGGSGIGLGSAIRLGADGAHVTICGRTGDKLGAAVGAIIPSVAEGGSIRGSVAGVPVPIPAASFQYWDSQSAQIIPRFVQE